MYFFSNYENIPSCGYAGHLLVRVRVALGLDPLPEAMRLCFPNGAMTLILASKVPVVSVGGGYASPGTRDLGLTACEA